MIIDIFYYIVNYGKLAIYITIMFLTVSNCHFVASEQTKKMATGSFYLAQSVTHTATHKLYCVYKTDHYNKSCENTS